MSNSTNSTLPLLACGGLELGDTSTTPLLRFSASSMRTFFYFAGSIGGPGLFLAVCAGLYLNLRQPLVAIAAHGFSPRSAYLGRLGALAALAAGLALLVISGVYAGAAVPEAAFMGAAIAIAAPGWAALAFALQRARTLGLQAALADTAAMGALGVAAALSLAWEVAVTGLATQDRAGRYQYSFEGVGWLALSINMVAAQLFTHMLLVPRGTVHPRALLALALQWAAYKKVPSQSPKVPVPEPEQPSLVKAAHKQSPEQPMPPLVKAFLSKTSGGRLPALVPSLANGEGYAVLSKGGKAATASRTGLVVLAWLWYLATLLGYSAAHYLLAPREYRWVVGIVSATVVVMDLSMLTSVYAGLIDSPGLAQLVSFVARVLVVGLGLPQWLTGVSAVFCALIAFLGHSVLSRLLAPQAAQGQGMSRLRVAQPLAALLTVTALYTALFCSLLRHAPATLPSPPVLLLGTPVPQAALSLAMLCGTALGLAIEACLLSYLQHSRGWSASGALLVAATLALALGLGLGINSVLGVTFAPAGLVCPLLAAFALLGWWGLWSGVNRYELCSARRNSASINALSAAYAATAVGGLVAFAGAWQGATPPPSPCELLAAATLAAAGGCSSTAFDGALRGSLGWVAAAASAMALCTLFAYQGYVGTLRLSTGVKGLAGAAGLLLLGLFTGLLAQASASNACASQQLAIGIVLALYPALVAVAVCALLSRNRAVQSMLAAEAEGRGGRGKGGGRGAALSPPPPSTTLAWLHAGAQAGATCVTVLLMLAVLLAFLSYYAATSTGGAASLTAVLLPVGALTLWLLGLGAAAVHSAATSSASGSSAGKGSSGGQGLLPWLRYLCGAFTALYLCLGTLGAICAFFVSANILMAIVSLSAAYGALVVGCTALACALLACAGAFATLLELPDAYTVLQKRVGSVVKAGKKLLSGKKGSKSSSSSSTSSVEISVEDAAEDRACVESYSQQLKALCAKDPRALLSIKTSIAAAAAASEQAQALAQAGSLQPTPSPRASAFLLSTASRLLLPGSHVLPAFVHTPNHSSSSSRPASPITPVQLAFAAAAAAPLLSLVWAWLAMLFLNPPAWGILASCTARMGVLMLYLDITTRSAREMECAVQLLSTLPEVSKGKAAGWEAALQALLLAAEGLADKPYLASARSLLLAKRAEALQGQVERLAWRGEEEEEEEEGYSSRSLQRTVNPMLRGTGLGLGEGRRLAGRWDAALAEQQLLLLAAEGAEEGAEAFAQARRLPTAALSSTREGALAALQASSTYTSAAAAATASARPASPAALLAKEALLCAQLAGQLGAAEALLIAGLQLRILSAAEAVQSRGQAQWEGMLAWALCAQAHQELQCRLPEAMAQVLGPVEAGAGGSKKAAAAAAAAAAARPPPAALRTRATFVTFLMQRVDCDVMLSALAAVEGMHLAFLKEVGRAEAVLLEETAKVVREREKLERRERAEAWERGEQQRRLAAQADADRAVAAHASEVARLQQKLGAFSRGGLRASMPMSGAAASSSASSVAHTSDNKNNLLDEKLETVEQLREALKLESDRLEAAKIATARLERLLHAAEDKMMKEKKENAAMEEKSKNETVLGLCAGLEIKAKELLESEKNAEQKGQVQMNAEFEVADSTFDYDHWRVTEKARLLLALAGNYGNDAEEIDAVLSRTFKGGAWKDSEFEPDISLDGYDPEKRKCITFLECLKGRAAWPDGIQPAPEHIVQGELGDCWLFAAFADLATHPYLVERLFSPNVFRSKELVREGVFVCKLWSPHDERWNYIALDCFLPCWRGNESQVFGSKAQSVNGDVWWVPLLEKAFVRGYVRRYQSLDQGNTQEALLRMIPFSATTWITLDNSCEQSVKNQWNMMIQWCALGHLLAAHSVPGGSDTEKVQGVHKSHCYTVLALKPSLSAIKGESLLQLRNPHGRSEFDGRFSDLYDLKYIEDAQWTLSKSGTPTKLSLEVGYRVGNADDGTFWISLSDFYRLFSFVDVTRFYPSTAEESFGRAGTVGVLWGFAADANYWGTGKAHVRYTVTVPRGADVAIILTARPEPDKDGTLPQLNFELQVRDYYAGSDGFYMIDSNLTSFGNQSAVSTRFKDEGKPYACVECVALSGCLTVWGLCESPHLKFTLRVHATLNKKAAQVQLHCEGENVGAGVDIIAALAVSASADMKGGAEK